MESPLQKCPSCGGTDIVRNITMSQSVEIGYAGLQYKSLLMLTVTEPLLADLCRKCGTVVRMHVKTPDRKWETKS